MKGGSKHTWDVTQRGAIVKNTRGCRTNCEPVSYSILVSSRGSFSAGEIPSKFWDQLWDLKTAGNFMGSSSHMQDGGKKRYTKIFKRMCREMLI